MKLKLLLSIADIFLLFFIISGICVSQDFKTGNETLMDSLDLLKGKNIGLITNNTGINSKGNHIIFELIKNEVNVKRIFTPEHGFNIDDYNNSSVFNIETVSLYGQSKNISSEHLKDIDILIFDVQDVGARFYTYISTLYLTMKDAEKYNKEYIICDRPSITNLNNSEGYLLEKNYISFVGMLPIPVIYGMTIGELGLYIKENSDNGLRNLKLRVMRMKGYTRETDYNSLNLKWVNPSPNIRSVEAGRIYPALCFLEGTNISEGRGTDNPFTLFGAPFCSSSDILSELKKYQLEGVDFEETEFLPESSPAYLNPKYKGKLCYGVKIIIEDYRKFSPMKLAVAILIILKNKYVEFLWTNNNFIDKLAGTDKLRKNIDKGMTLDEIVKSWEEELNVFNIKKEKILLYSK